MSDEPPSPSDTNDDPPSERADSSEESAPDPTSERPVETDSEQTVESEPAEQPRDSITEGSLIRPLFQLAWPIVVIQLLQVTYNVVDTLYLGRLSADAVGAVSLAFPLIFLLISVAAGFTTAGAILVAQYTGAKGDRSAGLVAGQTVSFVSLLSVVIAIIGLFYTRPALELLPTEPDTGERVIPLAADYMEIIFLGMPFLFGFFIFSALLRGYGDTRTPMYVMVLSVVVNILLNPFLIFGFENNPLLAWLFLGGLESTLFAATGFTGFGIEGAALATVVARGIASVIGLYILFFTTAGPTTSIDQLWPDPDFIVDIVKLGTPSMIENSANALAQITLIAIVVTFSPAVVAAYGLGNRIISLVFLPAMGLGRAIDTVVGQNLGAERPDRASRAVYLAASTAAGVMVLVAVVAVVLTEPIVSVFLGDVENAPETIAFGVEYVRTRAVEFAFIGVTQVLLGAFRGAGNTTIAMAISIVTLWVGRVGTVLLLVFGLGWGESGIWFGMAVGNILGAAVAIPWFLRGSWKETYIDDTAVGDSTPVAASED